jgi:hypothetical protein
MKDDADGYVYGRFYPGVVNNFVSVNHDKILN